MEDRSMTSPTNETSAATGPVVSLQFNGASNPNKVRRGADLQKLPAADALDASGNIIFNVSGNYTLQSGGSNVTVGNTTGPLNGRVSVTNVQSNMTIQARLTTNTSPAVSGIYTVVVEVIE